MEKKWLHVSEISSKKLGLSLGQIVSLANLKLFNLLNLQLSSSFASPEMDTNNIREFKSFVEVPESLIKRKT